MVAATELKKNQVPARNQVMTGSLQGFTTFCQLWNCNYAKPLEYSWLLRHRNLTATSSNFSEQIAKTVFAGHTECKCPAPGHKWLWLLGRNLSQNGPTQWFGTRSYLLEADEVLSLWPCNWKQKARLHWPCSSVCRGPYLNTSTERRQASASSFFPVLGWGMLQQEFQIFQGSHWQRCPRLELPFCSSPALRFHKFRVKVCKV